MEHYAANFEDIIKLIKADLEVYLKDHKITEEKIATGRHLYQDYLLK